MAANCALKHDKLPSEWLQILITIKNEIFNAPFALKSSSNTATPFAYGGQTRTNRLFLSLYKSYDG
jgi:hypothetical protein